MRRRLVTGIVLAVALLACSAAPAGAATIFINFDSLAPGTTVNTIEGVTFVGGPKVFDPVHVATVSEPNALHTNGSCSATTCPSGANKLELTFAAQAGLVAMYVGLDDEGGPFEFGTGARLVAFNSGGVKVGDSGLVELGENFEPITKLVQVTSASVNIAKVVLTVDSGGTPRRVNIDSLEVQDKSVPVAPPHVDITAPATGLALDRADDLRVSGLASAGAGILRFCLKASASPPGAFPADCDQRSILSPPTSSVGSFKDLRVGPLITGTNHITAWLEDQQLHQTQATIDVVLKANDLRVTNMEVTQAVQKALPKPAPDDIGSTHSAAYEGVPLIDDKSTAVRVWTSAQLDAAGTPVHGAALYLYGERPDGSLLPGGPIPAREGSRDIGPSLSFGPLIDQKTWSNPATSWTFELPWAWQQTHGPITLRAVVNPPTAYPHISECAGCGPNNTLSLTGIRFQRAHTLNLYPFRVFYSKEGKFIAPPAEPWRVFREVIKISPFDVNVHPWVGTLNAQSIADNSSLDGDGQTSAIMDRLTSAIDIAGYPGFFTLAVNRGLGPGVTAPHFSWHSFTVRTYSVVEEGRPLTSVGHEIYHAIDYTHAGTSCDEAVQRGGAEFWPPEDRGDLESLGTDITGLYGPGSRQLKLFGFFDSAGNPTENFDLMSYCFSDEEHVWISALNWERAVGRVASATGSAAEPTPGSVRPRLASPSSGGPNLGVSAEVGAGAGHILRVEPGHGRVNAPAVGSEFSFRVRDGHGNVVSETPVAVQPTHIDLVNHGTSLVEVSAVVPAAGAASIELVRNGVVLDIVRRSPSAPKVRLLAPRAGLRVGSHGSLKVRWRAKDRDGGRLLSAVEFSADGGRHWKALVVGEEGSSYSVPISYLSHSDRARIRVEVGDGWNQASATSGRFSVEGPPPQVTIETPANRTRLRAGDPLNLEGRAFDDSSKTLSGHRLQWFDGHRSLGHGPRLSVLDLSPGKHTVRLVATDRRGRSGQASIQVTVTPAKPAFIVLEAPKSLSRKARKVTIRAAASLPGTVASGDERFPIDRRTRKYRFKVRPGHGPLRLKLALRGGGRTAGAKLSIPRH